MQRILFIAFLAMCASFTGCNSGGRSARSLQLYQAGDYSAALREGATVARGDAGLEGQKAALVAGLSAYELKNYSEAEKWLRQAAYSADPTVSGRAAAGLGLCGVARDRYSTAAIDLSAAGRKLRGDEAAQANYFAGECYTLLGRLEAARKAYNDALLTTMNPALRAKIERSLSDSEYTLQLGAFSSRVNAGKAASAAGGRASGAGLGAPTIIPTLDVAGRTIYIVQVGKFKTRPEAMTARAKLGGDAVIVPARH